MCGKWRRGPALHKSPGSRSDAANLPKLEATAPSTELPAATFMWFAALTVTPHSPVGEFPKPTRRGSHGYEDAEGFVHPLAVRYLKRRNADDEVVDQDGTRVDQSGSQVRIRDALEETRGQIDRIDPVVEATGIKLKRIKCVAMEGLDEEGPAQD
jgi:hypothetical protein